MPDAADNAQQSQPPASASPIAPGTLDGKGRAFDPKIHLPKMHPKGKNWLPRNQKKIPVAADPTPPAPASEAPVVEPAPPAPAPSVAIRTGSDPTESIGQAMAAEMPPITGGTPADPVQPAPVKMQSILADVSTLPEPEAEPENSAPGSASAPAAKDEGDPDADAEIVLEMVFDLTGFATGHADESRPASPRVASMRRVLSAWLKKKGWVSVGGWAVAISFAAWAIETVKKPKTRAVVRRWFGIAPKDEESARVAAARNVTPAPVSPAPQVPAPVAKPQPAKPADTLSAFAGGAQ
jgi:hypothetical protein